MSSVLVVDDDPSIRRTLAINLRAHGHEAEEVGDGRSALQSLHDRIPDLVVLDLGLPDLTGLEVLRAVRSGQIRGAARVPVIVLSARHGSDDKVEALDAGADDYVTKPFGMDELMARVRVAVRRGGDVDEGALVRTDAFELDPTRRQAVRVLADGSRRAVKLTPTEWHILDVLTRHPGALVSQRQLLSEVWGPAYEHETHYLRVYLAQVRRKLEPVPSEPRYFLTEPGMGYRFVDPPG